jgi:hypothetical protein
VVWRTAYETSIARDLPVPAALTEMVPMSGVVLVVADVEALSLWRLWRRLIAQDLPTNPELVTIFLARTSDPVRRQVPSLIPPGDAKALVFVDPELIEWPLERMQAWSVRDGRIVVAMTGPPTEDAWEEFQRLCG